MLGRAVGGVLVFVAVIIGNLGTLALYIAGLIWSYQRAGILGAVLWLVFGTTVVGMLIGAVTIPLIGAGARLLERSAEESAS